VSDYSGGQKQRIAFARAIVTNFRVLFGDEPTGNLDPNNADTLMDILKNKVSKTNKSAIIVSHDINLGLKFADRILVINGVVKKQKEEDDLVYGLINNSSVFQRINNDSWVHLNKNLKTENLKTVLLSKMSIS
jgi:ABC-type cobalamin/Fe3+-siderophores transport system ATPase subunit